MNKEERNVLLVFIKNPQLGKVKTRLAEKIGDKKALRVYQKLLNITRNVTEQINCDRQLWYSQYIDNDDSWSDQKFDKKLQKGNDLGERMDYAFQTAFASGYERAIIIGSDCAELSADIIEGAFNQLAKYEVVVGPSQDGGYYLLGMQKYYPQLFKNMPWSTPSVFDKTIARINELELDYKLMPVLNDIDTKEDLRNAGDKLQEV